MNNWTATNELRFVKRIDLIPVKSKPDFVTQKTVRILQQKWAGEIAQHDGSVERITEWRDVPVVENSDGI